MGPKWDPNGTHDQTAGPKWDRNGTEMGPKWDRSGPTNLSSSILFVFYFTVLILTFFLRLEFAYFQVSTFAVTTVVLSGWLYYLHFIMIIFYNYRLNKVKQE